MAMIATARELAVRGGQNSRHAPRVVQPVAGHRRGALVDPSHRQRWYAVSPRARFRPTASLPPPPQPLFACVLAVPQRAKAHVRSTLLVVAPPQEASLRSLSLALYDPEELLVTRPDGRSPGVSRGDGRARDRDRGTLFLQDRVDPRAAPRLGDAPAGRSTSPRPALRGKAPSPFLAGIKWK